MRGSAPLAGLALLAMSACATVDTGKPAEKPLLTNPTVMGTVTMSRGTVTQVFTAYDFPASAPAGGAQTASAATASAATANASTVSAPTTSAANATAWFGHRDNVYYLNIRAFPDKQFDAKKGILSLVAILPDAPVTGMTSDKVTVRLVDRTEVDDIPKWSSIGQPSQLDILSITPDVGSQPATATLTANLTSTVCSLAAPTDQPQCIDLTGVISTKVAYEYP